MPCHFVLTALKSHGNPDVRNDLVELKIKRLTCKLKFDDNSAKSLGVQKVNMPVAPLYVPTLHMFPLLVTLC